MSSMQINDYFKKGNDEVKRLPKAFSFTKYQFSNYLFQSHDGDIVICPTINYTADRKKISKHIKCENYELLCNMLSLRELINKSCLIPSTNLNPDYASQNREQRNTLNKDNLNQLPCDKITRDEKAIAAIKKWCVVNGYPFTFDAEKYENACRSKNLFGQKEHIPTGFLLSEFLFQLNEIYYAFQLCRVITGQTTGNCLIGKIAKPNKQKESRPKVFVQFEDIYGLTIEECKEVFASKYAERHYKSNVIFDKGGVANIRIHAENLFDAAFYQLALFLNEPIKEVRICPLCDRYYEANTARQKYCRYTNEYGGRTCYPQKVHKRKMLAAKKQQSSE